MQAGRSSGAERVAELETELGASGAARRAHEVAHALSFAAATAEQMTFDATECAKLREEVCVRACVCLRVLACACACVRGVAGQAAGSALVDRRAAAGLAEGRRRAAGRGAPASGVHDARCARGVPGRPPVRVAACPARRVVCPVGGTRGGAPARQVRPRARRGGAWAARSGGGRRLACAPADAERRTRAPRVAAARVVAPRREVARGDRTATADAAARAAAGAAAACSSTAVTARWCSAGRRDRGGACLVQWAVATEAVARGTWESARGGRAATLDRRSRRRRGARRGG